MKFPKFLLPFLFLISTLPRGAPASAPVDGQQGRHLHGTMLFAFGDSYADTGNIPQPLGRSWKPPYGITFPGEPTGRFSDGRVLTDYVAEFYGLKSPVTYRLMKLAGIKSPYGVNFAYGGTGVFDTLVMLPNMTIQIDFFEELLNQSVYTKSDLQSSLFLLSVAGNDYAAYTANGGAHEGLAAFTRSVVNQIGANMERLHRLGARKVAITALPPFGCLPDTTFVSSFQLCDAAQNSVVGLHNLLLTQLVAKFNNDIEDSSFTILDLFASFTTVLENEGDFPGSLRFETPLKPCCMGIGDGNFCGSVDDKGEKLYKLCNDRETAFFWDDVHPTQAGWHAVYGVLKSSLELTHYHAPK